MLDSVYPLTLLYDASCAVCRLEMEHLRERSTDGRLHFVDITAPGFDPARYGATLNEMNAVIHGITADGRTLRGVEVLRLAYAAAGLGWVLRPSGWPVLQPFFDAGYRVFARHRRGISQLLRPAIEALEARRALRRMQACRAGQCDLERR